MHWSSLVWGSITSTDSSLALQASTITQHLRKTATSCHRQPRTLSTKSHSSHRHPLTPVRSSLRITTVMARKLPPVMHSSYKFSRLSVPFTERRWLLSKVLEGLGLVMLITPRFGRVFWMRLRPDGLRLVIRALGLVWWIVRVLSESVLVSLYTHTVHCCLQPREMTWLGAFWVDPEHTFYVCILYTFS